jgi:hypothetical protein
MGVSLENYRAAIGVFNNRSRVMYRKPLNILPSCLCFMCLRLLVASVIFYLLRVLAGDVEVNPGPSFT